MTNNQEELLKLYELIINEEHYFIEAHQTRIKFYTSIISAILAATVAGVFKATAWFHFSVLCLGPFLAVMVSRIAVDGTYRLYQRFLEAITVRAKIEQLLGFTRPPNVSTNTSTSYWGNEALVPERHIRSRKGCASSESFIDLHSEKGYHLWTMRFFRWLQLLSLFLLVALVALAIAKHP